MELKFGISYSEDFERAKSVIREIVESHEKVLPFFVLLTGHEVFKLPAFSERFENLGKFLRILFVKVQS